MNFSDIILYYYSSGQHYLRPRPDGKIPKTREMFDAVAELRAANAQVEEAKQKVSLAESFSDALGTVLESRLAIAQLKMQKALARPAHLLDHIQVTAVEDINMKFD